jgi:hypothetical protein
MNRKIKQILPINIHLPENNEEYYVLSNFPLTRSNNEDKAIHENYYSYLITSNKNKLFGNSFATKKWSSSEYTLRSNKVRSETEPAAPPLKILMSE